MSSPESPDNQDNRQNDRQNDQQDARGDDRAEGESSVEDDPTGDDPVEDTSEAVVQTTECPNCGRRFVGDYCPSCGQEADPSASATGVVGGFLRELFDLENGIWPTFVGLTLRPGETLQKYLSGVRKGLASPGRYLLAAVVVTAGTRQISRWIGALPPPVINPYMRTADGKRDAVRAAAEHFLSAAEQVPILSSVLFALPLALSLWTLFRGQFSGGAEALAVGTFLGGQVALLSGGVRFVFACAEYFSAGFPGVQLSPFIVIVSVTGYVGIVCWGCFGPGWKPAAKGTLGGVWAWMEVFTLAIFAVLGPALWLYKAYPGAYYVFSPGRTQTGQVGDLLTLMGISLVPLLLHAGLEAYYRLR